MISFSFSGKYALFLCIFTWLINTVIARVKLQEAIANNPDKITDIYNFLSGYWLAVSIPFLLLLILQFISNLENPLWLIMGDLDNKLVIATHVIVASAWSILIWWLWLGDGTEIILQYQEVFGNIGNNPDLIKKEVSIGIGINLLIYIIYRLRQSKSSAN